MENQDLTKQQAIDLIGGQREIVHCFLNPNGMLVGADWTWPEFIECLEGAERITEAGDQAKQMKHPLAVLNDNRWHFFEVSP